MSKQGSGVIAVATIVGLWLATYSGLAQRVGSEISEWVDGHSDEVVAAADDIINGTLPSVSVPNAPSEFPVPDMGGSGSPSAGADSPSTTPAPNSPTSSEVAASDAAITVLATLPVKGRAPMTGYDREAFIGGGQAWPDDNDDPLYGKNGCDTRNDILRRDLVDEVFKPGTNDCVVLTGVFHDPYTGDDIDFTRGSSTSSLVQIDHVVALANAWVTGAQSWDDRTRRNYSQDPYVLLASDGAENSKKGAGDAATYLPPNKSFRCDYVARQVGIKAKYGLWVTQAEHDAIAGILSTCPNEKVPA